MSGYEMMQELEARTGGVWRPSPGSIYPTLALLADEGLISNRQPDGRKLFSLTEAGVAAQVGVTRTPWSTMADATDPGVVQLREAVHGAMAAARQVASTGTAEQRTRAISLIKELRRQLYLILADQ